MINRASSKHFKVKVLLGKSCKNEHPSNCFFVTGEFNKKSNVRGSSCCFAGSDKL